MKKIFILSFLTLIFVNCTNNYKRNVVYSTFKEAVEKADYKQGEQLFKKFQTYASISNKNYDWYLHEMYRIYAKGSYSPKSEDENDIIQAIADKGYRDSMLYRIESINYMFPIYDEHILEGNISRNFRISDKELCEPIQDKTPNYKNVSNIDRAKRANLLMVRSINALRGGKCDNKYDNAFYRSWDNSTPRAEYYEISYSDTTHCENGRFAKAVIVCKNDSLIFMNSQPTKGLISEKLNFLISKEYGIEE